VEGQRDIEARAGEVTCSIDFLRPYGLQFTQTDQYDPNPEPQITLREWHLTAATPAKVKNLEFVVLYRLHRNGRAIPKSLNVPELKQVAGGYLLTVTLSDGRVLALLPRDDSATLAAEGLSTQGKVLVQRYRADGSVAGRLSVGQVFSQSSPQ